MSKVSVVIATKNRPDSLNNLLRSIDSQTSIADEIIIVDQSDFNQRAKLFTCKNEKITYIHDPSITGLTQARNIGVKLSNGTFIFFFDDDLELHNNFIEVLLEAFNNHPNIVGLCGEQLVTHSRGFIADVTRCLFQRGPYSVSYKKKNRYTYAQDGIEIRTKISGGITAYRSEIFSQYSFDEHLIKYALGEDFDFSYRVSKKYDVGKCSLAKAYHYHVQDGRLNFINDYAARICFYKYFYEKNCSNNEKNYYLWAQIGVVLSALYDSAKNTTVNPLKGVKYGFLLAKKNYIGSPCICLEKESNNQTFE